MRHLIERLVAELAARPAVLQMHAPAHVAAVVVRWQDDEVRLAAELGDLGTMVLVETCRRHGCPVMVIKRGASLAAE